MNKDNFLALNELQDLLVDKDTGLPLSNGRVYFYLDTIRTVPKTVYRMDGSIDAPIYVSIPNPCVLNSSGIFVDDSGNPITPYIYPYDENNDIDNISELYYIEVRNSVGVLQFTQTGVPWTTDTATANNTSTSNINYVKNGQFDNINSDILTNVEYSVANTSVLSDDGVYRNFINSSTSYPPPDRLSIFIARDSNEDTDKFSINTFNEIPIFSTSVEAYASRYLRYVSSGAIGETRKDIQFNIENFKAFSGKTIGISFQGRSALTGDGAKIRAYAEQSSGAGPAVKTYAIPEIELNSTLTKYFFTITIPSVDTVFSASDNYFAVGISLPLNLSCSFEFTNIQANNSTVETDYAYDGVVMTSALDISKKISDVPEVGNESPLVIPLGYTNNNYSVPQFIRDSSNPYIKNFSWNQILPSGLVFPWFGNLSNIPPGFLLLDYTAIPSYKFSNLYNIFTSNDTVLPMYGSGTTTNATHASGNDYITVVNNREGPVTAPVNNVSGITVNVTQVGDFTHPLTYTITVDADTGADIDTEHTLSVTTTAGGDVFYPYPAITYNIVFVVDNIINSNYVMTENALYDTTTIFVYIRSTWTSIEIAQHLLKVFYPLSFPLPDTRSMFLRGVNGYRQDAYMDPSALTRTNRGDGTAGNNVGTMEAASTLAHVHPSGNDIIYHDSSATYQIVTNSSELHTEVNYLSGNVTTGSSTGDETRPNNINTYYIIKT